MAEIDIKEINDLARTSKGELVRLGEEKYLDFINLVAERILGDKNIKILLLAGPSGSGKTTTANLISDRIKSHGEDSIVVSLDDFYLDFDSPAYPLCPDGTRDLESVYALDIPLLRETMLAIADSREFSLPRYDFKVARRVEMRKHAPMPHGCVIIEGLHALNPLIFSPLPSERCLKLFISVSTNVCRDGERIISGRKIRFLRRMIRDSIYRGADAERTLELWRSVLVGEDKYLYPNRVYADITADTFHIFELSVMRPFAEARISDSLAAAEPYAATVLSAVREVEPIDISLVPMTSLIREFIPGGKYESLY